MRYIVFLQLSLFFLLFLTSSELYAQEKTYDLTGSVSDTTGWGMEGTQIILRKLPDSSLQAFTTANIRGEFLVAAPEGEFVLELRMIGYYTQRHKISVAHKTYKKLELDFVMDEDPEVLQEIVIEDRQLPVVQKEDTLEFVSDYFKGVGDDKIIDVLKKIPGVEVMNDGSIFYKNKKIQDILVDGESLFKQSPETIARAFPSDAVDKIQILENYAEFGSRANPFGDEKAINLTIKDEKKNVIFGDVSAGSGVGKNAKNSDVLRYRIHGNLFWLKKKFKSMWISDFNNVGKHTFDMKTYRGFAGSMRSSISREDAPVSQAQTELPPQVHTYFSALSLNYKFSDKLRWQNNLFFNQRSSLNIREINRFYTSDEFDTPYREASEAERSSFVLAWRSMLTYVPNGKHSLKTTLNFNPQHHQNNSRNRISFLRLDSRNEEQSTFSQYRSRLALEHLFTINSSHHVDTDLSIDYQPATDRLALLSDEDVFSSLLPADIWEGDTLALADISQRSRLARFEAQAKTTYAFYINKKLTWRNIIGNRYLSENDDFDWEQNQALPTALDISYRYRLNRLFYGSYLYLTQGPFEWRVGSDFAVYHLHFRGTQNSENISSWQAEPATRLRIHLPGVQHLTFNYKRSNNLPTSGNLNESYAIADFRRLRQGESDLQIMPTNNYNLAYSLSHLYARTFVFLYANYSQSPRSISQTQLVTAGADVSRAIQVSRDMYQLVGSINKSFEKPFPFSLRGQASLSQFMSENILNERLNNFSNFTQNYNASFDTRFKEHFNVSLSWRNTRYRNRSDLNPIDLRSQMHYFKGELVIDILQKIQFKPQAELVYFIRADEPARNFFFLNATLEYRINKKYRLLFESFNALNTQQVSNVSITPFYEQTRDKTIFSRFILLSMRRDF
ncbi:MAG: hypothetical protein JJT94_10810 [Bernardetiaceae bacterium]|nr:hypothetical protein [Bernardetiaceae bacterium]